MNGYYMMISASNETQTRCQEWKEQMYDYASVQESEGLASNDFFKKDSKCLLNCLKVCNSSFQTRVGKLFL